MSWFWLILTIAALAWYGTVTVYVAIRGLADIRQMLAALGRGGSSAAGAERSKID